MSVESTDAVGDSVPLAEREPLAGRAEAHPFLSGLPREQVLTIAECASATDFVAAQVIFREGDLANRFYLILDGCVALEATMPAGGTRVIDSIGPEEVLGWSWMFPPFRWHYTARALHPTKAIFVYGSWLLDCCEPDPALGYELTKRIAVVAIGRLQAARSQLAVATSAACHG